MLLEAVLPQICIADYRGGRRGVAANSVIAVLILIRREAGKTVLRNRAVPLNTSQESRRRRDFESPRGRHFHLDLRASRIHWLRVALLGRGHKVGLATYLIEPYHSLN